MERQLIIDKLYDKADKNNIGLNETELEYKESVADWIEKLTITKANDNKTSTESDVCECCGNLKVECEEDETYLY